MNRSRIDFAFWVVLGVGLLASLVVAAQRNAIEDRSRSVEIVVAWDEMEALHLSSDRSYSQLLKELHDYGVRGIAIAEDTLESLERSGQIKTLATGGGTRIVVNSDDPYTTRRLQSLLGAKMQRRVSIRKNDLWIDGVTLPDGLKSVGVGFSEKRVRRVEQAGLQVIARPTIDGLTNAASLDVLFQHLASLRVSAIAADGTAVLGYKDLLPQVAARLRESHIQHCSIEFGKQLGDERLSRLLDGEVVPLHSITVPEMAAITPRAAVERFARAVKERGIRICYVRLFLRASENVLLDNASYLAALTNELERLGYKIGPAAPLEPMTRSWPLSLIVAVGVWAGVVLLLGRLGISDVGRRTALATVGLAMVLGLAAGFGELGWKATALVATITFPLLGLTSALEAAPRVSGVIRGVVAAFLVCAGLTATGGFLTAGLLSERVFFVRADTFAGVKFAHVAPLIVLFAYLLSLTDAEGELSGDATNWKQARMRLAGLLQAALRVWHLLLALLVLVVTAIWLARTGNQPETGLMPGELRVRSTLEHLLIARPRTKEFLLAHPAFILGLWLWNARGRTLSGVARLLILLAAVGQISIANTFCHLHTPITLSLLRVIHGVWMGAIGGAVLVWVYERLVGRRTAKVVATNSGP